MKYLITILFSVFVFSVEAQTSKTFIYGDIHNYTPDKGRIGFDTVNNINTLNYANGTSWIPLSSSSVPTLNSVLTVLNGDTSRHSVKATYNNNFSGTNLGVLQIKNPQGAEFDYYLNATGAIKLKMPVIASGDHPILNISMTVTKNLNPTSIQHIDFGCWFNGASQAWGIPNAIITSTGTSIPIRVAYDGTNPCLLVGDTTTTWTTGSVVIDQINCSYGSYSTLKKFDSGWSSQLITTWANLTVTAATTTILSGSNTGDQTVTLNGDITGTGTGAITTSIGINKVSYSKIQTVSASKLLGNPTGATANLQEITPGFGLAFNGTTLPIDTTKIAVIPTLSLTQTGGTPTFQVYAKQHLMVVSVWPTSNETISIGTTSGGTDIEPATAITGGSHKDFLIGSEFSRTANTTIFLSGAAGSVTYDIIKQ